MDDLLLSRTWSACIYKKIDVDRDIDIHTSLWRYLARLYCEIKEGARRKMERRVNGQSQPPFCRQSGGSILIWVRHVAEPAFVGSYGWKFLLGSFAKKQMRAHTQSSTSLALSRDEVVFQESALWRTSRSHEISLGEPLVVFLLPVPLLEVKRWLCNHSACSVQRAHQGWDTIKLIFPYRGPWQWVSQQ